MTTQKAFLQPETGAAIHCLFNPESLSVSMGNSWSAKAKGPGKDAPRLTFGGTNSGSMDLKLTFDTTATGKPVTETTSLLMGLMEINNDLPNADEKRLNGRPPYVVFHWGDLHSFKAVVTSLRVSFTYFSSSGVPLRADADLSLQQYEPAKAFGRQNPTSGTPYPHRVHRLQPGETLDRISARYYGDPTQWRRVAEANGIGDPLAIRPGALLAIPLGEST